MSDMPAATKVIEDGGHSSTAQSADPYRLLGDASPDDKTEYAGYTGGPGGQSERVGEHGEDVINCGKLASSAEGGHAIDSNE